MIELKIRCSNCGGIGEIVGPPDGPGGNCPRCEGSGLEPWGSLIYPKVPSGVELIFSYQVVEATVDSEYVALSSSQKEVYKMIISLGQIDFAEGSNVRDKLLDMFGEGTTTRTNLLTL